MIFQKNGRRTPQNFTLGTQPLENTDCYKYLGTIITNTGNFKTNHDNVKKKGIGVYSKPSTVIKIFEKTIEPILMYNSEITNAYLPTTWNFDKFKQNMWNIGNIGSNTN